MLTGLFEGQVVEEGHQFLDADFADLDDDMQVRIREWTEDEVGRRYVSIQDGDAFAYPSGSDRPLSMNDIKEDYENSWESVETDEPVGW